jgi:hypothetical protein
MTTVNKYYAKVKLTGGTSDALDSINSSGLNNNDFAIVQYLGNTYNYIYDSAAAAAEDSPFIIVPDDLPDNGVWELASAYGVENKNLLLNPDFSINQDAYDFSASISATNYFIDGWFNKNGNPSQSISYHPDGGLVPGANGIAQLYGLRTYVGGAQISGPVQSQNMTISAEITGTGGIDVYTGYGSGSGAALTLTSAGTLSSTTTVLSFTANFGATTDYLAVDLRGTGRIQYIKIESGTIATRHQEIVFLEELARARYYYAKSYNYDVAPGAITDVGAVSFRNWDADTARGLLQNLPGKVATMHKTPTATIYSSNSGTAAKVYDAIATGDVAVSSVPDLGATGFSELSLGASIPATNYGKFHYVLDARP